MIDTVWHYAGRVISMDASVHCAKSQDMKNECEVQSIFYRRRGVLKRGVRQEEPEIHRTAPRMLCLLCDNDLFALRLRLALPRACVLASALLLDATRIQHRALELRGLVDRLRHMVCPDSSSTFNIRGPLSAGNGEANTHLETFPTSGSNFHRSLRLSRYSMAARSRASMTPSLSDACAFHMRTMPSSDPLSTNRASAVKTAEVTLEHRSVTQYHAQEW